MSYLLTISSDDRESAQSTDNISIAFAPALRISGNWELALQSMTLWYSYYNISPDYNNQIFRYNNGSIWKNITITPGLYTIDDLNAYIQSVMLANGDFTVVGGVNTFDITLTPNYNTFKLRVSISGGYQVDFTVGNLNQLLGFTQIIVTTTQEGLNNVNITNGVDRIIVHCDAVSGTYKSGLASDVLFSFAIDGKPSSLITIEPYHLIYLPINKSGYLDRLRMYITDNLGRRINFNGETITYSLSLRQMR